MDLIEKLKQICNSPEALLARFAGNSALLERFLMKFPTDQSYQHLIEAVENSDQRGIEMYAHTLKGVTANLGIDILSEKSADVVNAVRTGESEEAVKKLVEAVTAEYIRVVDVLNA